jgi:fructosamine-3-kinase
MKGEPWKSIAYELSKVIGGAFSAETVRSVGGGCISETVILSNGSRDVFVKKNAPSCFDMFEAEAAGLRALGAVNAVRVPEVYAVGQTGECAWLGMEKLDLSGAGEDGQAELGRRLALLHQSKSRFFGWERDNTIGSTLQRNPLSDDWVGFFRSERLGYQFELAAQRGGNFEGADRLLDRLPEFFDHYTPEPALLHGDLWSGNVGFTIDHEPVIFDPAVHYGDREAEFGIIGMFGGFSQAFYQAYQSEYSFAAGFEKRRDLYLLYHQLNHFNLFGAGYCPAVRGTIDRLLAADNR